MRAWIQAARPLAQANIAIPLLFGEMLAFAATGSLDVGMLVVAHAFGLLNHLFIVFANDVADEAGDRINETYNAFSGGSRVLPEGKLTRKQLAAAAAAAVLGMLALSGGIALAVDRPAMLAAWGLSVVLVWAYSFAPLRLSYNGMGEAAQGFGVGVVLPLIGYYLQVGQLQDMPWAALVPSFVLAAASNISTALPDHPADVTVDKATWSVRFTPARARKHSLQLIAIATLLTPLVLPALEPSGLVALQIAPAVVLLVNLRGLGRADAEHRRACARFVFFNGLAINLALGGWCIALAMGAP